MTMDETTKGKQDKSSANLPGSTSTPETFTKDDMTKAVSDALANAGRDAKSLEKRGLDLDERDKTLKAAADRIDQWQKDRDAEELEAAKGDPDRLKAYQDKYSLKEERRKIEADRTTLERDKLQHAEDIRVAAEIQRETSIWNIAEKYGLDASKLKELNLSVEDTERVASTMGKPEIPPLKVDSGKTRGGENWRDLSADEKLRRGLQK